MHEDAKAICDFLDLFLADGAGEKVLPFPHRPEGEPVPFGLSWNSFESGDGPVLLVHFRTRQGRWSWDSRGRKARFAPDPSYKAA